MASAEVLADENTTTIEVLDALITLSNTLIAEKDMISYKQKVYHQEECE